MKTHVAHEQSELDVIPVALGIYLNSLFDLMVVAQLP
jgi:hypothetical protein